MGYPGPAASMIRHKSGIFIDISWYICLIREYDFDVVAMEIKPKPVNIGFTIFDKCLLILYQIALVVSK